MTTQSVPRTPRPPRQGGGRAWHRVLAGALALITALGVSALFAPSASAALASVGPVTAVGPAGNTSNYPSFYTDKTGLSLAPCLDGLPNCLTAAADLTPPGGELFYFDASATVGPFSIANALEGAFFAAGPDNEQTFMRTQIDAAKGGLTPNGVYTINDPYGTLKCTADGGGVIKANGCRTETPPSPLNFTAALGGRIGPFLTWDTYGAATGAPPAGYIGDNVTPHKVTGSPIAYNKVSVQGPGMTGGCTLPDGSNATDCAETDLFVVQGKVAPGVAAAAAPSPLAFGNVGGTAPVTKSITYTNTSTGDATTPAGPVTVSAVTLGGADAAQYAMTEDCTTAAAGIAPGASCKVNVTFTPKPGASSAATVTIADSTPVASRVIDVTGSYTGTMVVDTPVPPAGVNFGDQAVNASSAPSNVVIGNTGTGPISIASATITGASSTHYKPPTNGCTTPVASGGGCEIGVVFAPTTTGPKNAQLNVTDSNGKTVSVPLTGNGVVSSLPGAPTGVTATAGNAAATVKWTAPTNIGGSAITGYSVRAFDGATLVKTVPVGNVLTTNVTGLTNGTAYTFDVAATNGSGTGAPSTASTAVTPVAPNTAPATPAAPTATAGNAQATVNWTAPANGGSPITGYTVRTVNSATGAAVGTPLTVGNVLTATVTGLTNGTAYKFTVAATNAVGTSAASAPSAAAVTPTAPAANAAPTVTVRSPAINATGFAKTGNILVTFSEAVTNVTTSTVVLKGPLGGVIATTVTKDTTVANRWIVNPTPTLAANSKYTLTLTGGTTGIKDTAGAALVATATSPLSWSFTTGP